jgi:hypothetical protein
MYLRHLVVLTCIVGPKKETFPFKPTVKTFTGFVISVGSQWIWVTAGHCLKQLDDLFYQRKPFYDIKLCPCWSKNGQPEIRLPLRLPDFISDLEDGIDYGHIFLDAKQKALLESDGIIPFDESRWKLRARAYDGFEIIGVPGKLWNTSVTSKSDGVAHVEHSVGITLAPVIAEPSPPPEVITKYHQFYGILKDENDDGTLDERALEKMDGMSGGPIMGVGRDDSGKLSYWPVAIQSSLVTKFPPHRYVCGCPILVIGNAVEKVLSEVKARD